MEFALEKRVLPPEASSRLRPDVSLCGLQQRRSLSVLLGVAWVSRVVLVKIG